MTLQSLRYLSMTAFVHLHVHSDYSLGTGASKVKDLVARAKAVGIPAFALTDTANMHGALSFSKEAVGAGVQPIVGTKLWTEVEIPGGDKLPCSLILLAQTDKGYLNVCTLIEESWLPQPQRDGSEAVNRNGGNPTVRFERIVEEGALADVIVLTGGHDGLLRRLIEKGLATDANDRLVALAQAAPGRVYVEFCRNEKPDAAAHAVEDVLFDLAKAGGLPVVATTEVFYSVVERHASFDLLRAIREKGHVTVGDGQVEGTRTFHLRSAEEMATLFADMPEAVANTIKVARRCAFKVEGRSPILPPFPCEGGRSEADEMASQARAGLETRLLHLRVPEENQGAYYERLEFEIGVIQSMGFSGYFLIVSDFIRWALANEIPVGPGRGSGAGSLVAYALRITDLDPLAFGLLFERFLNPDRVSMPDFDIDFCQDRRGEVIKYVRERYGSEHVSSIITFMEIKAKAALSDVGRILRHVDRGGYGFGEIKSITKLIPKDPDPFNPLKLKAIYETVPSFAKEIDGWDKKTVKEGDTEKVVDYVNQDKKARYELLLKQSQAIEGLYRNSSSHAAGIVISGLPIREVVPVGFDDDPKTNMRVCQFNMKDAEASGLVKFDFLGLTTLSIIREATTHVRDFNGYKDFDASHVPLDDPEVYQLFEKGQTTGVFQFESEGMRRNLRDMKPTRIEDLIAANALYRPGPMEMFPIYNNCKNGVADPDYPEPKHLTSKVLEETFGIMVYQEQVMQIAREVSGYTLAQADLLRRAMGKKIKAEMEAQRARFVEGAVANGVEAKHAEDLFALIEKFASYGFNKSHSAAYAVIAYRTAYLKCKFRAAFYAAQLSYEDAPEQWSNIKDEMDALGVVLLPFDINQSKRRFAPERLPDGSEAVRMGLLAIKGLSSNLDALEKIRAESGPFKDLQEFSRRAGHLFNKANIDQMVAAGCFDSLDSNRARTSAILHWLAKGPKPSNDQSSLFGGSALEIQIPKALMETREWDNRAEREFLAVGFYFNAHPLDLYRARSRKHGVRMLWKIEQAMLERKIAELDGTVPNGVCLAGMVEHYEKVRSRNGREYFNVKIKEKGSPPYWLKYFESRYERNAQSFKEIERLLRTAQESHTPIVVYPKFSLNHTTKEMTVWPSRFALINEALADIRSDMTIELDERVWAPVGGDLQKIERLKANRALAPADIEATCKELAAKATAQDSERLLDMLAPLRSDDEGAVQINVVLRYSGMTQNKMVPGRYRIDDGFQGRLRSLQTFSGMQDVA